MDTHETEPDDETLDGGDAGRRDAVLVMNAETDEEAEVVRATLEAAGIPAFLQMPNPSAGTALLSETVGDTWASGVYVAPADFEAARAILSAPPPSEDELTAEQEADSTTLAEAEARVK